MKLSSRQLEVFLAVAECRNFGRAAETVGLAPSALGSQIRRLEDLLGGTLFTRGRRSAVALTKLGETFFPEAVAAVAGIERASRIGSRAAAGGAGAVALGYVFSAAVAGVLSQVIATVAAGFPDIVLTATPMDTPEQLAGLSDARLDAALIRPRRAYPEGIEARIVHAEPMMLALSAHHPLAALASITLADIGGETFLIPQRAETTGLIAVLADVAATAGYAMPVTRDASDFVTAVCIAAAGREVILAPRSLTNLALPNIQYRRIADFDGRIELAFAWRTGNPILATIAAEL